MPDEETIKAIGQLATPANTFIEKISGAIGILYEPKRIVRKAVAEAQAAEIKAISDMKIGELQKRTMHRLLSEEIKNQHNIESVIEKTLPQIESSAKIDSMSDDWIVAFFNKVKMISNDEMQLLWSKILSGEANKPGSFSIKTLSIVSELGYLDIFAFTVLSKFQFNIGNPTIVIFDENDEFYGRKGIGFGSLTQLDALGLIRYDSSKISGFVKQRLPKVFKFNYFGKEVLITLKDEEKDLTIGCVMLTQAGQELLPFCKTEPDKEIFDFTIANWRKIGHTINT